MIGAYMLSCPERAAVREATLARWRLTDWGVDPTVFVDDGQGPPSIDRETAASLAMLRRALRDGPDFILFVEDDLDFNLHLRWNLYRWAPLLFAGRCDFWASLYNPGVRVLDETRDAIVADPESVFGSQAILLSRGLAGAIIAQWDEPRFAVPNEQDIRMAEISRQFCPLVYHRPSLVQHVAGPSTTIGVGHTAPDFDREWRDG